MMSEWLINNKAKQFHIPLFEARKCILKYGNSNYSTRIDTELSIISRIYNKWDHGTAYPKSKDNIGKITLEYLGYDCWMRDELREKYYHDKNIHEKINTRASYTHITERINIRSYYIKEEQIDSLNHLFYINE